MANECSEIASDFLKEFDLLEKLANSVPSKEDLDDNILNRDVEEQTLPFDSPDETFHEAIAELSPIEEDYVVDKPIWIL